MHDFKKKMRLVAVAGIFGAGIVLADPQAFTMKFPSAHPEIFGKSWCLRKTQWPPPKVELGRTLYFDPRLSGDGERKANYTQTQKEKDNERYKKTDQQRWCSRS